LIFVAIWAYAEVISIAPLAQPAVMTAIFARLTNVLTMALAMSVCTTQLPTAASRLLIAATPTPALQQIVLITVVFLLLFLAMMETIALWMPAMDLVNVHLLASLAAAKLRLSARMTTSALRMNA